MDGGFVHLHVHSNFSMLDGACPIDRLVEQAKRLGMPALAITDHDGLYGAIRFYKKAREAGIRPIIGAELTVGGYASCGQERVSSPLMPLMGEEKGGAEVHSHPPPQGGRGTYHLVLLAKDREGYSNLCRLVTHAHLSQERGSPKASIQALREHSQGLIALSGCRKGEVAAQILRGADAAATASAERLAEIFGRENFFIELPGDCEGSLVRSLARLANRLGLKTVATNNVHYIEPSEARIHQILTSIKTLTTIHEPNPLRREGSECYFKSTEQMKEQFADYPEAIANAVEIADRCRLDLGLGQFHFPRFPLPPGHTPESYLEKLCWQAAVEKYGARDVYSLPANVIQRLRHELGVIRELGFPEYFLVVWDIVRWARSKGIRCSGRGSAADSLVSYLLGLTNVDPVAADLLFERFLNPERREMPDVDLDFDSRRRDEVIAYVYERFGQDCVAAVATVSTYNARSAIREVGRALGLPAHAVDAVSKSFPHIGADQIKGAVSSLPEVRGLGLESEQLRDLFDVCQAIAGFPRHLSVHLGGMVIGPGPLTDYLPVEMAAKGVAVAQFDKDDIEALGLVKMDLLGLRNLAAIEEAVELLRKRGVNLDIDKIPLDDEETYRLLRSTKTVGVFQLESPGMRGLLRALQPTCFDDIVANISLFRPGPMQADMIGPFLARRHGKEPVAYPHPAMEPALRSTYGVILYQEQVLQVASAVAGFSLGQADALRRAMTHDRSEEEMEKIREAFLRGALENGVDEETARDVFHRISAFAAYGFCKAHAACFGYIAYQTAYLKAHYPAEFLAAILSNQPMGFYPPEVIVQEAKHLGIAVLPVDVNRSEARYTVEECRGSPPQPPATGSPQRGSPTKTGHNGGNGHQAVRLRVSPKLYPGASADRSHLLQQLAPASGILRGGGAVLRPQSRAAGVGPSASLRTSTPAPQRQGKNTARSKPLPYTTLCRASLSGLPKSFPAAWAIRVGLAQVEGISEAAINSILRARKRGAFTSLADFCARTKAPKPVVENLIKCGAFDSICPSKRELLWELQRLSHGNSGRHSGQLNLFEESDPAPPFKPHTLREEASMQLALLGMSVKCHPTYFCRDELDAMGVIPSDRLAELPHGASVKVAGICIARMRPPTRSGRTVIFITLEDESGLSEVTVFERVYQEYGPVIFSHNALVVEGKLQTEGRYGVTILAEKIIPIIL